MKLKMGNMLKRLFAMILTLIIILSVQSFAFSEVYAGSFISLYYTDATMAEGKSTQDVERYFSEIAGTAMVELMNEDFLNELAFAVDSNYKNFRVFVVHQKGMPATDLAMLYCFKDSTWLLKDTTSVSKSIYIDASWEILQGINLKLKQKELIRKVMPDYDDFYECNPQNVLQVWMQFYLYIEELSKVKQLMEAGTAVKLPDIPEVIDGWPLDLPISVQLPKELTVLDAFFTVEPVDNATSSFEQNPEPNRFPGTVGNENLITGTLRFWKAGPHLVSLVFTTSISGRTESIHHDISIDTSNVHILDIDDMNDASDNRNTISLSQVDTFNAYYIPTDIVAETAEGQYSYLTHAGYMAAENDDEIVIESYVQDHQSWWDNKVTVYLQSEDGAYFAYEMACSEEDAAKLVPGTKIRVTGYKGEWAGEVEIMDGTFEFVEAKPWLAEATDVTALLDSAELEKHMNEFVAVRGARIAAQEDGAAFHYKNPGEKTDDLYFSVDVEGKTYNFCVEFYLRGKDSDVYKAVEGLKVGDVVDIEGFLYWYNGPNLQATRVTVK